MSVGLFFRSTSLIGDSLRERGTLRHRPPAFADVAKAWTGSKIIRRRTVQQKALGHRLPRRGVRLARGSFSVPIRYTDRSEAVPPYPGAPDLNLPPKLARALLIRACVAWLLVRAALVVLTAIGEVASGGLLPLLTAPAELIAPPSPRAVVYHAAIVLPLLLVDLRINNERILLANLGYGRRVVVVPAIAVVCMLEAALALVVRP